MNVYYNDNDPYCCAWLRNLIAAGHLPAGDVDDRDIREVDADDLIGYGQIHFFAGLGGWPYALMLAGWEGPVWTGSCPCQPFSNAGKRQGEADERHLWPAFQSLIAECKPATVFGEQVASRLGREWLAGVRNGMENMGYAFGAADLPAACVGAPHIRQRLWWVADANGGNASAEGLQRGGEHGQQPQDDGTDGGLGDAPGPGLQGTGTNNSAEGSGHTAGQSGLPSQGIHFWAQYDLIPCADGKARRVKPGLPVLAHGVSNRVGRLRAYGNAINPVLAAEFVRAVMEARCPSAYRKDGEMQETPHLTTAHTQKMRDYIARSPPGVAHWSGSGPSGRSCRECVHFTKEGYYAASNKTSASGLKPGRCRKFRDFVGRDGAKFEHHILACMYFEENPSPPKARAGW